MGNPMVIGVSGKAGSGKDTASDFLVDKFNFKRIAFADKLKEHCKEYHNWDGKKDNEGIELLQKEGTDKHIESNPNVWVDYVKWLINMLQDDGYDRIIITDVRFPSDAEFVKTFNISYMIRIEGRKHNLSTERLQHRSEIALDDYEFDYVIDNNGTLGELERKMLKFGKEIIEKDTN